MNEEEFDKIVDIIEDIRNNTSDISLISDGISSITTTLSNIRKGIDKNNELLQELIDVVYNKD